MAINLEKILSVGGRASIDLLNYAVRAVQVDLLFTFLVGEYRNAPTAQKAGLLYEIFCAPNAPARVTALELLPPVNRQLEVAIRPVQTNLAAIQSARSSGVLPPPVFLPPKFVFDAVARHLQEHSTQLRRIRRNYRKSRTPSENLPGGRMSDGQRFFVDKVWLPNLRPRLVAAGFWHVTCIG